LAHIIEPDNNRFYVCAVDGELLWLGHLVVTGS